MRLAVEGIGKAFGDRVVLRGVSFTAENGITRILGPSGAGKTTLARILLGLEKADSGTVSPSGIRWTAVFQGSRLLEHTDAAGNLRFVLGRAYDADRAQVMLRALGLDLSDKSAVSTYSGGMKRRLALARALLCDADATLLDEPFTGLDPENRRNAMLLIEEAAKSRPILLISHEQDLSDSFPAVLI